jgi:hypothetical protein
MKVIGAGMDRTGTVSLQTALEILGYNTYHAISSFQNWEQGHLDMWSDAMEGKKEIDFNYIFRDYQATTALPAFLFYRELMEAYPKAKVILTVRDPEAWWASWSGLVKSQAENVDSLVFLPRFAAIDRMIHNFERLFFKIEPNVYVKEDAIATFIKHNEEVIATVPPERLLVFDVREGWEPLCKFLGHPIPRMEFPNTNSGNAHVDRLFREMVERDMKAMGIPMPQPEKEEKN